MEESRVRYPAPGQDIWNYLAGKYYTKSQLTCILELDGRINFSKLARAVRLSLEVEPVLGCRLIEGEEQAVWEQRKDLDELELCCLVETNHAEEQIQKFIARDYDFTRDCQVKVQVIREKVDILCVKLEHGCSDAAGLKYYVKLLESIYKQLFNYQEYKPKAAAWENRTFKELRKLPRLPEIKKTMPETPAEPVYKVALPFKAGKPEQQLFLSQKLLPEQFAKMKEFAKKQGATVHDVLLAAYARAVTQHAHIQDQSIPIHSTVDLRRYLHNRNPGALCNMSGMDPIEITLDTREPFVETLYKIIQETKKQKDNGPGLKSIIELEPLNNIRFKDLDSAFQAGFQQILETGRNNPWFSNIGIMSEEPVTFGLQEVVDYYMVGPANYSPGLIVLASTYANTLTLTVNFFQSTFERGMLESLMSMMVRELKNL